MNTPPRAASTSTLLLKPEAVAHELQISRVRVFAMIKNGEIESVRIGNSRRIPRDALHDYVSRLRTAC